MQGRIPAAYHFGLQQVASHDAMEDAESTSSGLISTY